MAEFLSCNNLIALKLLMIHFTKNTATGQAKWEVNRAHFTKNSHSFYELQEQNSLQKSYLQAVKQG